MDEIIFNWWSETYRLGMTKTGEVYHWDGATLTTLKKEAHRSSIVYRRRGSATRISRQQFLKTCRTCRMVIEREYPF